MKTLRREILSAPLFLPLVAVCGAIAGGWWCCLALVAVMLAALCRLGRIALCTLLCALVAGLHTGLLEQRAAVFVSQAEEAHVVELAGTVERSLHRGIVLNTGWNGVRVLVSGNTPFTPGDEVKLRAAWREEEPISVPGVFSRTNWMRGQGITCAMDYIEGQKCGKPLSLRTLQYWGLQMREKLVQRLMPPGTEQEAARQILCALVLGDKEEADAEIMAAFRLGGCLHAFAVSGLHVGLVSGILWLLFRLLRVRPLVVRPLLLLSVGVYVLMTGCAVPAIRAYLMLAVLLLGYMLRRRVSLLNTWSFAALLILMVDSSQLYNAGFLLSFGVYAAICLTLAVCLKESAWFGPDAYIPVTLRTPWEMRVWRLELGVRGAVVVALSAWLVSIPITLAFFHSANCSSFLTNIAITPLLPVVMFCGLLHLCLGVLPWVGIATAWAALKSAALLLSIVAWFGELPYAYLPAQKPAPLHTLLVQGTGYGNSFTMLGNHGLLIDCGTESTAISKTVPTLFHSGFTPAVLLVSTPLSHSGGGSLVLQRMWPQLQVLHAHELPPEGVVFETQAGKYTIIPPPPAFQRRQAMNHHPVVLWESPAGLVLYVGQAAYAAFAAVPEVKADVCVLGAHGRQPVSAEDVDADCKVLLPDTRSAEAATHVGEQECLILPLGRSGGK